jgi:Ca2+-binding RTX toxin-like protein
VFLTRAHDEAKVDIDRAHGSITVNLGGLADQVQIVNDTENTDNLTVNGTSGDDIINKVPGVVTFGAPVVETVYYSGDFTLVVDGGAGNDTITDPGQNTIILGGPGNDTIIINATTGNGVIVDGGGGSDTYIVGGGNLAGPVTILDSGTTGTDSVTIKGTSGNDTIIQTSSGVMLNGTNITLTSGLESATVDGGGGTDQVVAAALPPIPIQVQGVSDMVVAGTSGNDQIVFNPGNKPGEVVARLNGVVVSRFSPTGRLVAFGLAGNDDIQVAGGITLPAWLYGDAGNDRLNAGNGGSLLFGGDDNDQLLGGNGRDVMIGGNGADNLVGNANDDILVAGFTLKDNRTSATHDAFWSAVLAEWNSSNSFTTRVNNLHGTGGLLPQVVDDCFGDQIDFLNGASGNDWLIFLAGEDKVVGQIEESN